MAPRSGLHWLRISGRQRDPIGQLSVQADLEGVLARPGQGNIEYQNGTGLDVHHSRGWLPELDSALTAEKLAATLVYEADADGVNADFRAPPANPQHQVGAGIYRREVGQPHVLEHAEHAELALLVDQGVIGYNSEVEMQLS
jgi:hypothetical protein